MDREILKNLRRSSMMMAFFAGSFVLVYAGVVLLTKFMYIYFRGFIPEFSETILRAVFYGLAALFIAASAVVAKRRYAPERLKPLLKDIDAIARHLLLTPVLSMALAEAVLICGFFLFFLSAMYADFFLLAGLSLVLIFKSVPGLEFLETKLKEAKN